MVGSIAWNNVGMLPASLSQISLDCKCLFILISNFYNLMWTFNVPIKHVFIWTHIRLGLSEMHWKSALYQLSVLPFFSSTIFIRLLNPLYQICSKVQPIFSPSGIYWGSLNESPNIRAITACAEWHSSLHSQSSSHVPLHLSRHPAREWSVRPREGFPAVLWASGCPAPLYSLAG